MLTIKSFTCQLFNHTQLLNLIHNFTMLRYLNFKPSFKLRWCCAPDVFVSQVPVTTGGFKLRISCIRNSYITTSPQGVIG